MRVLVLITVLVTTIASIAQEPTLAERANALRHTPKVGSDTKASGTVVDGDYHNEYLGLTIRKLQGWESLGRGEMNVREASGRAAMGMPAGIAGSLSGRVFGMNDSLGSSLFVSVLPVPPDAETRDLGPKMQAAVAKEMPQLNCGREQVLLGDAQHQFAAFRCENPAGGQVFYQGQQAIIVRGYLISMTITSPTAEKLTQVLRQLRGKIQWSDPT